MSHWRKYHARWAQIAPPLRPDECLRALAGGGDGRVLLLGVTPELADAFSSVFAADKNPAMVANVWPGDTPTKEAAVVDWLDLDLSVGPFAAVVGDGSLNVVPYPRETWLLTARVFELMAPGSRFACRLYERPERPFTRDDLMDTASRPAPISFHAFKWQLAMHLAEQVGASIPVALLREQFNDMFPDRDELSRRTGWPRAAIELMDVYRGSPVVYAFPNRQEFLAVLPEGIGDTRFRPLWQL
jgi:hypothetical protein